MKKKAILGFMTGAAIVAATTGSYAAWDSLTAINKNASVEIKKPVTVTTSGDVLSPLETAIQPQVIWFMKSMFHSLWQLTEILI